jgi:hypothetical protein
MLASGAALAPGDENWDGAFGSPGMNADVCALAVSGTTLYAGGYFTTAGGVSAKNIAKWDGTSWSPLASDMTFLWDPVVDALAISRTDLYAGGDFYTVDGVIATYIAKWDGSAWSALGAGVNSTVYALETDGSDPHAGGEFWEAGGVSAEKIAK